MAEWIRALPELLLALGVLGIPGLVLAVCLRYRPWDALAFAVPLSLGALAVADEVATQTHTGWGLPVIAGTIAVLAVLCLGLSWVGTRFARQSWNQGQAMTLANSGSVDGATWHRLQHRIALVATLGAAIIGAIAVARGMGSPDALNQSVDGAYHVNAINAMAHLHSAAPGIYGQLLEPTTSGGFYPPLFAGTAALLVIYTGIGPVMAANVTAVAIAFLWPLSVSIAVRRIARPTSFGYFIAMVGAVTVGLFPALLLNWGTVWPNALSILALPAALVTIIRLFGLDRAKDGTDDPNGRLPWFACLIAAAISAPGLLFAQPSTAFAVLYLAVPVVIWFGWRRYVDPANGLGRNAAVALSVLFAVAILLGGVVWASDRLSVVATAKSYFWPAWEAWPQAVGQMMLLCTNFSGPNLAFAVLVIVGLLVGLRHSRGRVLVVGYLIFATLAVLAAGTPSPAVYRWTGYWYNDYLRIAALLPVVVLPLAALAADEIRGAGRAAVERLVSQGKLTWRPRLVTIGAATGIAIILCVLLLQKGLGTARISHDVAQIYTYGPGQMVSPEQEAMYRRLKAYIAPGETIAGNPFTGESLAGVISGRSAVYPTLAQPLEQAQVLVGLRFSAYRSDASVCAAVKALHIGVVVTGPLYHSNTPLYHSWFAGFDNMASIPGLTQIDSGGGATAYRVGACAG